MTCSPRCSSKTQRDEAQVADLVRRGANLPAVRSFADGGMHPTFAASVQFAPGRRRRHRSCPGLVPGWNHPRQYPLAARRAPERIARRRRRSGADHDRQRFGAGRSHRPQDRNRVCLGRRQLRQHVLVVEQQQQRDTVVVRQRRWRDGPHGAHGRPRRFLERSEKPAPAEGEARATKTASKSKDDKKQPAKQTANANANPGAVRPKSEPAAAEPSQQQTAASQPPAASQSTINGAQPTVPAGSFDNRFGAWR